VIFALFGFLVVSGILRKNKPQMAISALVIFLYGYFVWGIFPIEKKVSWDGHLSGLISGIIFAFLNKHQNIAIEKYEFSEAEEEKLDNLPESEKYWLNSKYENFEEEEKPKKTSTDPFVININYEYKLKVNIKKDSDNE
jgi:hypothetical protein